MNTAVTAALYVFYSHGFLQFNCVIFRCGKVDVRKKVQYLLALLKSAFYVCPINLIPKKHPMKKFTLVVVAVVSFAFASHAQIALASAAQAVSINLHNHIDVSLTAAASNNCANGPAATFRVCSNTPWVVTVKTAAESYTGPANNTITGARAYDGESFSATAAGLTAGKGAATITVNYKAAASANSTTDARPSAVVYTATQE